jgi:TolB-like protein/tetratricopeptide (TPR) repeat protein
LPEKLDQSVRTELERIVASKPFGRNRLSVFLRFVVEQALEHGGDTVKEHRLGVEVFGRSPSYDPRTDPVVRVQARQLRFKLTEYYATEGLDDPLQIELPKGSYLPVFIERKTEAVKPAPPARRSRAVVLGFLLAASVAATAATIVTWRVQSSSRRNIQSVVVLPFENLTGDPRNEYLADGVTEQLTDSLAHIPSFRVVARTSAFQFKGKGADIRQIGRQLDVDAVVEGSLRKVNGRLRLTVQVNRAATGYHIFSQSFEGGMQDLARLEDDMVLPVLAALGPSPGFAKHRTAKSAAYDLYLRARASRGQATLTGFEQAVTYLNQAIEDDPGYADAYAALAGVYAAAAGNFASEPLQYVPQVKAAAAKAIQLDAFSARAYAAEGFVDALILLDWKRGEAELRNAIRLMPEDAAAHNWLGLTLMAQGGFPEALSELRAAENLDPLAAASGVSLGLAYYMARRYDDAMKQFGKVQRLHPDAIVVHPFIGSVWEAKGVFDKAMAEYESARPKIPYDVEARIAHLLAATGKRDEARKMLALLEHPQPDRQRPNAFDMALIYSALGDRDKAFAYLTRAYDDRKIVLLKVHPLLDPLRDDPRFGQLLKKAGLQS